MSFEDPYITLVWVLAGGLSLFLLGMRFLSEAFQTLGERLIRWSMNQMGSSFSSVMVGVIVSFLVQSGLSTSLMASSYATSGIFSLNHLMAFLLGANLGSVFTPWVFIVNWGVFTVLFLVVGIFPMIYSDNEKIKALGKLSFSMGLLALGQWLVVTMIPVSTRILYSLGAGANWGGYWPIFLVFFALSVVVRSSVALIGLLALMTTIGLVDAKLAMLLVIFTNTGSSLPGLIDSWGTSHRARYGNYFNIGVNVIVGLGLLFFFEPTYSMTVKFSQWILGDLLGRGFEGVMVGTVVSYHLVFNLLTVVVGVCLLKPVLKGIFLKLTNGKKKEVQKLVFVGRSLQASPSLGLNLVIYEARKMSAMVESILLLTREVLSGGGNKNEELEKVIKYEKITDNICDEISLFAARLIEVRLSKSQGQKIQALGRIVDELESVADQCKGIVCNLRDAELGEESQHIFKKVDFFFGDVLSYYEMVFVKLAEDQEGIEKEEIQYVEQRATAMKSSYLSLLKEIQTEGIGKAELLYYGDLLISLNQIRSHTLNIYQALVGL